ncbi:HflX GTPase family protein [Halorarius halobius]|uniref:HflX GTPase family protein n=1 Tax=Halorarius halobius TaxID=2962671 RepID=UPI0020CDE2C3|nr:GTPase [Halorarius halobius]
MSRAVIGVRTDSGTADTTEIEALAGTGGYEVVHATGVVAPRDATYNLPPRVVDDLATAVADTGADTVVVDADLTPGQAFNLAERFPEGTTVLDRYRLVLDVFEAGAGTKAARLQVERARLEHELPRLRERINRDEATEITRHDEEGKPIEDHKRRIDELTRKLKRIEDPTAERMARRREAGFDCVALAGYTNAGKTTLLRRLAAAVDSEASGPADLDTGPGVADRLFETLGTTTRRATFGERPALVTDTVGFVSNLPHDLVAPFEATLTTAHHADVVVLVVDGSDPAEMIRRKVAVARDQLADTEGAVVPVVNKVDRLDGAALATAREAVGGDPVAVSARDGGLSALRERVLAELPTERTTLRMPNCDAAMSLVSWAYDHTRVHDVSYGDRVTVELSGRPAVVAEAKRRASETRAGGQ